MKGKIIKVLWWLFGAFWALTLITFVLIWFGIIGYMPDVEQLQNPIDKYASVLISDDGVQLGSYAHGSTNRIYVSYDELAEPLVQALIATEDVRFYQHSGVDMRGVGRAVIKRGVLRNTASGGGSTITQQLAKQLYSPHAKSTLQRLLQKPIEWVIAIKLERNYTKEEIIAMYLNQFDFLYNAIGIRSAAQTYFGKTPSELTLNESAMLVGMCKNPSLYNPVLHADSDAPLKRRNTVLLQMEKAGYISDETYTTAAAEPIRINFTSNTHSDGLAPYYREFVRLLLTAKKPKRSDYSQWNQEQYAIDSLLWETQPIYGWCQKNKKSNGSHYDLYADGLKIYGTIDSRMQQYAEEAVQKHMSEFVQPNFDREMRGFKLAPYSSDLTAQQRKEAIERALRNTDRWRSLKKLGMSPEEIRKTFDQKRKMRVWSYNGWVEKEMTPRDSVLYYKHFLHTGFMAMNPHNGNILAYVGDVDFRTFKYDMVSQGRRQVGSTIKPFLYSLSMIQGISPCEQVMHQPITLYDANGKAWTPRNTGAKRVGEMVSIKWGLQNSSNWVTAYLMGRTSPYTFVRLLHSFGIKGDIDPVVSVALGTPDVTVSEMVAAYSAFVNQGIRVDPIPVTRIEDRYGNVVATFTANLTEVLPARAALQMLDMMRAVVDGGTGGRLRFRHNLTMPLGGKTGTTQRNSDGWFVGFSPEIVAGCWVGGEERSIHFRSMAYGQGASAALPVFGYFMKAVYADPSLGYSTETPFNVPAGFSPCGEQATVELHEPLSEAVDDAVDDVMEAILE